MPSPQDLLLSPESRDQCLPLCSPQEEAAGCGEVALQSSLVKQNRWPLLLLCCLSPKGLCPPTVQKNPTNSGACLR